MANFEDAHYFVKDAMEIPIFNVVKEMNASDRYLKLILSGGDVLTRYFIGPQVFLTHDFDIKLTADKRVDLNEENVKAIYAYAEEVAGVMQERLSAFYVANRAWMDEQLKRLYGAKLARHRGTNERFKYFRVGGPLFTIRYRLRDLRSQREDVDELADVFVGLPNTISFDYDTFLGEDDLLSLDGSDYYIPAIEMEGLLIAGLGFVLWDTQRMIEYSRDMARRGKKNKLQRYINKQKAIYNDLNHPLKRLSCIPFEDYIEQCDKQSTRCTIDNQRFRDLGEALPYAQAQGYLSSTQAEEVRKGGYSLSYFCAYINKLQKY